jgi:hypothetical protein
MKETNELHPDHLNWEAYMGREGERRTVGWMTGWCRS